MTSRVASLRLQLIDSVSGPSKAAAGSLKNLDSTIGKLGKGATPEVRRLIKQLEFLRKKSLAIDDFTGSRKGLKEVGVALKQARAEVTRLEAALKSTANPTKKMQQELLRAKAALRNANDAFQMQKQSVSAAERAIRSYSVNSASNMANSQKQIRSQIAQTIQQIRKLKTEQQTAAANNRPVPRPTGGTVSGGGAGRDIAGIAVGGAVSNTGRNLGQQSFFNAVNFNEVAAYQAALGGFSDSERSALNRQAEQIGGDTRFSNVDVVKAQTNILQGGIRDTNVIMDLTKKVTDYALAMGVTLEEAAETVKGSALSKRINLKDANAIGDFVDYLVWMAKNGGMSDEDVRQYIKYGGASTTGAGLPNDYAAAIGMILRRSGVRGDEAGVFARSASSKLIAPTKKGRDALAAMGIDYNDFTTMPDALNQDGIGIMLRNNFGKRMTAEMQEAVADLFENGEFADPETGEMRSVASDSGEFVTRMSEILGPLFADSKGKVAVRDAQALAKGLSDYHKFSVASVDSTGLFKAIMSSNPTLAQLNAYFTDRQGGRANMIAQQFPLFEELRALMNNVPGGVANKIGVDANDELFGDWTKLVGTFETTLTRIGQDFEGMTRPIINFTNATLDGFLRLEQSTRQLIVAFGAAAAAFGAFAAFRGLAGLFGGGAAGAAAGGAAGAAGNLAKGAAGGFLMRNLQTGMLMGMALGVKEVVSELSAQYANDEKQGPAKSYDQGEAANRANYQREFGGVAFEGGWHRVGRGAAPAPGEASPYGEYTSLKGGGDTNISAPVSAPVNMVFNGVTLEETLAAARKAAAEVANGIAAGLSRNLVRSQETSIGGVKPYGD